MFGLLLLLGGIHVSLPSPILSPEIVYAAELPQVISVDQLITDAAQEFGVNRNHLYWTLYKESDGFKDAKIQSQYIRKDGTQEPSFGYCQFYMPSSLKTPEGEIMTYEMAIIPEVCIRATAYNFSIGNASQWSAWNSYQKNGWPK